MRKRKRNILRIPYFRKLTLLLFTALFTWITTTGYEYFTIAPIPDSGKPIEFLSNQTQDDLKTAHFKVIQSAQKSILLMIYSLNDYKLINELNRKSTEGISIRVICDVKASHGMEKKLNPAIQISKPNGKGLMHLKILVVDNEQVWIGSANYTGDSFRINGNLVTGFYSPSLAHYMDEKANELIQPGLWAIPNHKTFIINDQTIEMWFLPRNNDALPKLKDLIRSAKKTIRIAMYTWTRQDMAKTVIDAHKRGVDVEVVIDSSSGNGASSDVVKMLVKGGINIKISDGKGLLHHKFMVIDDSILVNGSANWTKAAFNNNDDCFMIFYGLSENQLKKINKLWSVIRHESKEAG